MLCLDGYARESISVGYAQESGQLHAIPYPVTKKLVEIGYRRVLRFSR